MSVCIICHLSVCPPICGPCTPLPIVHFLSLLHFTLFISFILLPFHLFFTYPSLHVCHLLCFPFISFLIIPLSYYSFEFLIIVNYPYPADFLEPLPAWPFNVRHPCYAYVHIHTDKLNDLHAYICNLTCLFD